MNIKLNSYKINFIYYLKIYILYYLKKDAPILIMMNSVMILFYFTISHLSIIYYCFMILSILGILGLIINWIKNIYISYYKRNYEMKITDKRMELLNNGFSISNYYWSRFPKMRYKIKNDIIFIYLTKNFFFFIPFKQFQSTNDMNTFISFIQNSSETESLS